MGRWILTRKGVDGGGIGKGIEMNRWIDGGKGGKEGKGEWGGGYGECLK